MTANRGRRSSRGMLGRIRRVARTPSSRSATTSRSERMGLLRTSSRYSSAASPSFATSRRFEEAIAWGLSQFGTGQERGFKRRDISGHRLFAEDCSQGLHREVANITLPLKLNTEFGESGELRFDAGIRFRLHNKFVHLAQGALQHRFNAPASDFEGFGRA